MSDILKAFLEHEAAIKRFLVRFTSSSQCVDDYAQETFLKGFAAEVRTPIKEPKAFLFKIAKNVVLADVRQKKRSPRGYQDDSDDSDQLLDEGQATPEQWLDGRKKLVLFAKAVAHLTPQCRKAFLMRRIDGLQYKQIANRMDISVSAVEKHVTNGLLKCNRYLREQGYDPAEFGAAIKAAKNAPRSEVRAMVKQDE
jgi:RNA polymerase sigma factor (sigma-70 family)